jgi:hypothetical protein
MPNTREDSSTANPYAVFAPDAGATDGDGNLVQPIVLDGMLGLSQLLRAGNLCVGSKLRRIRPIILVGLLLLSLVCTAYGYRFNRLKFALGSSFQAAAAGLLIFAITRRHGSLTLKLLFKTGLQKPERQISTITADGARTVFPRLTLDDPWSRYTAFSESEDMIILWRGPQYVPLPKEFCARAGEWDRLREFLYTRLPVRRL